MGFENRVFPRLLQCFWEYRSGKNICKFYKSEAQSLTKKDGMDYFSEA